MIQWILWYLVHMEKWLQLATITFLSTDFVKRWIFIENTNNDKLFPMFYSNLIPLSRKSELEIFSQFETFMSIWMKTETNLMKMLFFPQFVVIVKGIDFIYYSNFFYIEDAHDHILGSGQHRIENNLFWWICTSDSNLLFSLKTTKKNCNCININFIWWVQWLMIISWIQSNRSIIIKFIFNLTLLV